MRQREVGHRVAAAHLQPDWRGESKDLHTSAGDDGATYLVERCLRPTVVVAGLKQAFDVDDSIDAPDDAVHLVGTVGRRRALGQGHEVGDHQLTSERTKAGAEDVSVRKIRLAGGGYRPLRSDTKPATFAVVEYRREDAWGVEPGKATPVYRAVGPHQGGRVHVANEAVLADELVAHDLRHLELARRLGCSVVDTTDLVYIHWMRPGMVGRGRGWQELGGEDRGDALAVTKSTSRRPD